MTSSVPISLTLPALDAYIKIYTTPSYGYLSYDGVKITSNNRNKLKITQSDINAGKLIYIQDYSRDLMRSLTTASFTFSVWSADDLRLTRTNIYSSNCLPIDVSDVPSSGYFRCYIDIVAVPSPTVVNNMYSYNKSRLSDTISTTSIVENPDAPGGIKNITHNDYYYAVDTTVYDSYAGTTSDTVPVIYKVLGPMRKYGSSSPACAQVTLNGTVLTTGMTFTNDDVINGGLQVSSLNTGTGLCYLPIQAFSISTDLTKLCSANIYVRVSSITPPIAKKIRLTITENNGAHKITTDEVLYEAAGFTSSEITFTDMAVTSTKGYAAGLVLSPTSFTQADIEAGRVTIKYQTVTGQPLPTATSTSFFVRGDICTEYKCKESGFTVEVVRIPTPRVSTTWYNYTVSEPVAYYSTSYANNGRVAYYLYNGTKRSYPPGTKYYYQGVKSTTTSYSKLTIGSPWVKARNTATSTGSTTDQITWTLDSAATAAANSSGQYVRFSPTTFTQTDINSGNVKMKHAYPGSGIAPSTEYIIFNVCNQYGSCASATTVVNINVPTISYISSRSITITKCASNVVIPTTTLTGTLVSTGSTGFTELDANKIIYTYDATKTEAYSTYTPGLVSLNKTTFTRADILAGNVKVSHNCSVSSTATSAMLYFNARTTYEPSTAVHSCYVRVYFTS
jgi:hypothetical protein